MKVLHFVTYGAQSASTMTASCGAVLSTWVNPVAYTFEFTQVTCPACLAVLRVVR